MDVGAFTCIHIDVFVCAVLCNDHIETPQCLHSQVNSLYDSVPKMACSGADYIPPWGLQQSPLPSNAHRFNTQAHGTNANNIFRIQID